MEVSIGIFPCYTDNMKNFVERGTAMRSIKPGRGPSAMGAVGSVIAVVFGIFWTMMALSMEAPVIFPVFGILFILLGIIRIVYNVRNATSENRYSVYDITEDHEEPDPLNQRFSSAPPPPVGQSNPVNHPAEETAAFCPYCGARAGMDYQFCRQCGKKLP